MKRVPLKNSIYYCECYNYDRITFNTLQQEKAVHANKLIARTDVTEAKYLSLWNNDSYLQYKNMKQDNNADVRTKSFENTNTVVLYCF